DVPALAAQLRADQVFLALPASQRDRLLHLIKMCEDQNLEFKIVPDLLELMTSRVASNSIDGLPLIGVRRNQLRGWAAVVKRAIDVAFSAILLALLSPLLLVITILIKLTMPGPLLFRQERIGRHRRPFLIYKFRTMIPDAEFETGPVVATPGDSRVTWLGRLLRRFSLDELPQLLNVSRTRVAKLSYLSSSQRPTIRRRHRPAQAAGQEPRSRSRPLPVRAPSGRRPRSSRPTLSTRRGFAAESHR